MIGVGFVLFNSINIGSFSKLAYPHDPDHHACGVDDYKEYKYIYWVNPVENDLNRTVCLKMCPEKSEIINLEKICKVNSLVPDC